MKDEPRLARWTGIPDEGEAEIRNLMNRAGAGDPTDLAALRRALDRHPEVWRSHGDLAAHARDAWIGLVAGPDLALAESLARRVAAMQAELAGPDPSPLEALLAGRIVACWLQVSYADAAAAQSGGMTIHQADHVIRRQDSAHRRYLTAVGALATVRRMLGPGATAPGKKNGSSSSRPAGVLGTGLAVGGDQGRGADDRDLVLGFDLPPATVDQGKATVRRRWTRGTPGS